MKYVVYDAEYRRDLEGHAIYRAAERHDDDGNIRLTARDPRLEARWPFKRPVCLSWLVMEQQERHLVPLSMETIGEPEMDEAGLLSAFLNMVRGLDSTVPLVTWGGCASDEVQLRAAALRHGLRLPARMVVPLRPGLRFSSGHVDLMINMCGDAGRVHLAEACAAFRIPCKISCAPNEIAGLVERRKWPDVKSACEGDVLSTAAMLAHVLHSEGQGFSLFGSLTGLARFGAARQFRSYAPAFETWAHELERAETVRAMAELVSLSDRL